MQNKKTGNSVRSPQENIQIINKAIVVYKMIFHSNVYNKKILNAHQYINKIQFHIIIIAHRVFHLFFVQII